MNQHQTEMDSRPTGGYVRLMRSEDTLELLSEDPKAFLLLTLMAIRARWREGLSVKGLGLGQAFLGDYEEAGLTEGEYRGAKKRLEGYGLATFKATSRGTVATIHAPWIYGVLEEGAQQAGIRPTTNREQSDNEQAATKEKGKKNKCKNEKYTLPGEQMASINSRCGSYAGDVLGIIQLRQEFQCLFPVAEQVAKVLGDHMNHDSAKQNLQDFLIDMKAAMNPPRKPAAIIRKLNNYLNNERRPENEKQYGNRKRAPQKAEDIGRASGGGLPVL